MCMTLNNLSPKRDILHNRTYSDCSRKNLIASTNAYGFFSPANHGDVIGLWRRVTPLTTAAATLADWNVLACCYRLRCTTASSVAWSRCPLKDHPCRAHDTQYIPFSRQCGRRSYTEATKRIFSRGGGKIDDRACCIAIRWLVQLLLPAAVTLFVLSFPPL